MNFPFVRHYVLLSVLMLAVSACSLFPDRPPQPALHDFGPGKTSFENGKAAWSSVSVDAPEWLQNENIRYRLLYAEPTRVRSYSQDRWLAPPSALLAQRLDLLKSATACTVPRPANDASKLRDPAPSSGPSGHPTQEPPRRSGPCPRSAWTADCSSRAWPAPTDSAGSATPCGAGTALQALPEEDGDRGQTWFAGSRPGYRLRLSLLEFEQVFDEPQRSRVTLAFRATAHWPDSDDVAGERLFRLSLPTPSADAKGAVTASVRLVEEAVKTLLGWLESLPDRP